MNKKIHFVCLLKIQILKDNVQPAHWVGHQQLISLYTYDLFKRTPVFDEKQASVTENTTKQSVYGEKSYLVLLQEKEENVAEETNDDADINEEANKINDNKKEIFVIMKEEKNTFKYQETINVDIESFPVKNNHFGDQYMKLLKIHILKKQNYFEKIQTNVQIIQMNLRTYEMKSKQILGKLLCNGGCMHKWL